MKIEASEDEYSLIIMQIMKSDGGEYTCRASNRAGEAMCSARLNVATEDILYAVHLFISYFFSWCLFLVVFTVILCMSSC